MWKAMSQWKLNHAIRIPARAVNGSPVARSRAIDVMRSAAIVRQSEVVVGAAGR